MNIRVVTGIIFIAVAIFTVAAIAAGTSGNTVPAATNAPAPDPQTAQTAPAPAQPAAPSFNAPNDESNFYNIITNAVTQYNQAANDMAKGAVRHQRKLAICAAFPQTTVSNWAGTIDTLSATGDGNGVLSIDGDGAFTLSTDNNELGEGITDFKTLIPVNSALFNKVSQMKVGDAVYFSGEFNSSDDDCFEEGSLTADGAMQKPDFTFRFTDVREALPK